MSEAAKYSAIEALRDGRRVEIRALRRNDRADLLTAVGRIGMQSVARRFFGLKRSFSDAEVAYFVNVDFVDHVAVVAVVEEGGQPMIIGGGRYIVLQPGQAEVAFAVIDEFQRQGVGSALMRHLATIARAAGLQELIAEVLTDNTGMLKVFEKSGSPLQMRRSPGVVHVALRIT